VDPCCHALAQQRQWLGDARIERLPDGRLDARYSFRHALYRHVFYGRVGALARAQLHRRIAESLQRLRAEGAPVTAAQLASHFELGHEPMAALRHYAEAAENALRHYAPAEAMALTARALELLPRAAASPQRSAIELALAALRGAGAAQLLGVSSLDAKQAFERALALLDEVPEHPLRALVLHGLGLVLMVRGEYAQARALAERTHALATTSGDLALHLSACSVLGQVHTLQGRHQEAREWLERGIAACETLGDGALHAAFVVDPGVTLLATLAVPLLHLGHADQARARFDAAQARARRLGEPMAQMVAAWFGALFHVRLHDAAAVAELAEAMHGIVEQAALAQGQAACRWFRGWAAAWRGEPLAGFRQIRDAHDLNAHLGMFSGESEVLGYAAEALVLAGDWAGAQAQLGEAMALAQRLSERVYLPQLLVLQGRIAIGEGRPAAAAAAMRMAVAEGRAQGAVWIEMTTLTALCECADATAADLAALARVLAGLTEGLATAPVVRAREVLRAHPP
jgi:tetratricopeptide (TPR) repeat protein